MKKQFPIGVLMKGGAAVAAMSLVLAACLSGGTAAGGGGGSEGSAGVPETVEEEVTLNVVGYWDAAEMKDLFDRFETENPNIKLNFDSVGFDELTGILTSRMQGGSSDVDVYTADQPDIASWAHKGFAADLTDVFGDVESDFVPAAWESGVIEGTLRALPLNTNTWYMYYNKAALEDAGVPFPSADPAERMTWEEVTDAARKVQEAGSAKYGLHFFASDSVVTTLQFTNSAGGGNGLVGDEGLDVDVTNDGWLHAFQWYHDIFDEGVAPRGLDAYAGSDLFAQGETAFYITGPWQQRSNAAAGFEDFGVAPIPMFEGGTPASATGAWSIAMNPASENKEAALIFMDWMAVRDGGNLAIDNPQGNIPASSEMLEAFLERSEFQGEGYAEFDKIFPHELYETAVSRPRSAGFQDFSNVLTKAISDIQNGEAPESALTRAEEEIADALSRF